MIVAVANQKGGVGKTTIAVSLAVEWCRRGRSVLFVDGDPQGTAQTWAAVAEENGFQEAPTVVGMDTGKLISRQVPTMACDYDVVVIDTPPRLGPTLRGALIVSDLAVIPIASGGPEAWALRETLDVVDEAQAMRPELIARLLLNRTNQTRLSSEVRETLEEQTDVPVLKSTCGQRVAFVEALTNGEGPSTYDPECVASHEVKALVRELESLLWPKKQRRKPAVKRQKSNSGGSPAKRAPASRRK